MRKKLYILIIAALSLGVAFFILSFNLSVNFFNFTSFSPGYELIEKKPKLIIGETVVFVDIAKTSTEKQKGLSGRDRLDNNEGLLFVWDEPTTPGFWMKDMNFAIDIIWIVDNRVVGIEKDVQPQPGQSDNELVRHYPPEPITHVLEVNAGFSEKHEIGVGDNLEFGNLEI